MLKRKWLIVLVAVLVLWLVVDRSFDALVRWQLEKVANSAAGPGAHVRIDRVRAKIFKGSLELQGLSLSYDSMAVDSLLRGQRKSLIAMEAELLSIRNLSYMSLFRSGSVLIDRIEVQGPTIQHFFRPQKPDTTTTNGKGTPEQPPVISVDTLIIGNAKGGSTDITGKRASTRVEELDIQAGGLHVVMDQQGNSHFRARSAVIDASGVSAAFPPLYDLQLGAIRMEHPLGEARMTSLAFIPRHNEQDYHKVIKYETDLFQATVDTLILLGIDVARFLSDQALHVRSVHIAGIELDVYRDKTMPDGPWIHKPLPAQALRDLEWSLRVDTVQVRRSHITYNERDTLSRDYGSVAFSELEGTVLGFNNDPFFAQNGGSLMISAAANIQEASRVFMEIDAPLGSPNAAFTLRARTSALPFHLFNRMTDSLLQVQATAGKIHRLSLYMRGDDKRASGTLDLEYEELKIAFSKPDRDGRNKLMGLVANALVRTRNLKTAGNYRQGVYTIDRRRDRSIFNFLWNAVKAGAIDTVVPGIMRSADSKEKSRNKRRANKAAAK